MLTCFGLEPHVLEAPDLSEAARDVLRLLDEAPGSADELLHRASMSTDTVARALVELELAGVAAAHAGVYRACT